MTCFAMPFEGASCVEAKKVFEIKTNLIYLFYVPFILKLVLTIVYKLIYTK